MSLYNMVNGVNSAAFFILPMLGKHPDEYPRFRDCFTEERQFTLEERLPVMTPKEQKQTDVICVLTRVGGGNREGYAEQIAVLRATPGYIEDFDDEFDRTFATFVFAVPEQWKEDYHHIMVGNLMDISEAYKQELYRVYPKLREKFDAIFKHT